MRTSKSTKAHGSCSESKKPAIVSVDGDVDACVVVDLAVDVDVDVRVNVDVGVVVDAINHQRHRQSLSTSMNHHRPSSTIIINPHETYSIIIYQNQTHPH